MKVLVLGGTAEARDIAESLADEPGFEIVTSLAGRVREPRLPVGDVRVGGFGGAEGLREWLAANEVDALVVATHPFAARISANAAHAAAAAGVPMVAVRRPPWTPQPGDTWHPVAALSEAAQTIPALGQRVFLTVGRQGVADFAALESTWFLIRAIDPPTGAVPPQHELLLARGPFTTEYETELFRSRRIEVLVTKNSGGEQTSAKLEVARNLGLPVVIVDRPALPAGVATVESAAAAVDWLHSQ